MKDKMLNSLDRAPFIMKMVDYTTFNTEGHDTVKYAVGGFSTPMATYQYTCISKEEAQQAIDLYNTTKAEGTEVSMRQVLDRLRRANGTPLPLPITPYDEDRGPANIYLMERSMKDELCYHYRDSIKSCVVLAHSKAEALSTHPGGEEVEEWLMGTWPRPQNRHHIQVTELGTYVGNDKGAGSVLIISIVGDDYRTPYGELAVTGTKKGAEVAATA